jgi:hypothetical protein
VLELDIKKLITYRTKSYQLSKSLRVKTRKQALNFVDRRGYVFFWPIKGVDLPSLWAAVAGDRPVSDAHDDPGHITWGWKDKALDEKIWYYAKILRRKSTIVSLDIAPYFYALSENYGSPDEDYILAYEEGRLTRTAKQVYEALLKEGALNTIDLRRTANMGNSRDSEFNRALEILQADFKILPVGIADAGSWHYSFIYEIVTRYYPDLPERARRIGESEARQKLTELYFNSVGAAQPQDIQRLFGWKTDLIERTLSELVSNETISEVRNPKKNGKWLAFTHLSG